MRRYIPPWWYKENIRWQDTLIQEIDREEHDQEYARRFTEAGEFRDEFLARW